MAKIGPVLLDIQKVPNSSRSSRGDLRRHAVIRSGRRRSPRDVKSATITVTRTSNLVIDDFNPAHA